MYWLLAYHPPFFQAYDAKHVKTDIFLPSSDLVYWQTNIYKSTGGRWEGSPRIGDEEILFNDLLLCYNLQTVPRRK